MVPIDAIGIAGTLVVLGLLLLPILIIADLIYMRSMDSDDDSVMDLLEAYRKSEAAANRRLKTLWRRRTD